MRSHAKAASAGSTKRLGKSKPALLLCVLAASVAALALVVGSASGATTRFLVETFGSAEQPAFPADRGMAFDQGASQLYVIDSTNDTISRFDADGSAANFSALGSNVIDGEGTGDETPLGHLAFESNRQREQIAIDESGEATDGNIYATRSASDVVDVFASNGEYLGTLSESTEGGAFGEPCGVAVDDEGTVYVGDRGDDRIHVFDPVAAVPVNGDSAATSFATLTDPCTLAAGSGATDGFLFVARSTAATLSKLDAATGEVKYEIATGASTVSVDPGTGHVFVARNTFASSSVDEYDASGAAEATLVSSFKPGSTVEGIALNSGAEQVYVARSSTENVEVFGPAAIVPDVVTSPPSSNTGVRATLAGTVNPDGVELDECFFEWGRAPFQGGEGIAENITPCAETPAEIGAGTTPAAVSADVSGLVPQGAVHQYRLVATNANATINGSTVQFTTPNTVVTTAASGIAPTEATLNGTVNPDTATISGCVFEWGLVKGPGEEIQQYPEAAPCVPGPGSITGTAPVAVHADLVGLHPGTEYVYRVTATYPTGSVTGSQMTAQTSGPRIVASWSEGVVRTEATLKAEIDPEGSATTYRFEYGTSEAYGQETPELSVGSDSSVHEVTNFLEGLAQGVTYHYRVVATNGGGTNEGPDRTFTTYEPFVPKTDCPNQAFRYGAGANLPDCRAYEMVSPVDKNGGAILAGQGQGPGLGARASFDKAAIGGEKITYTSATSFADAPSNRNANQYLASRTVHGWTTQSISPPLGRSLLSPLGSITYYSFGPQFSFFSEDLASAWLKDHNETPLTADAAPGFANLYRRDNLTSTYEHPVITSEPLTWADVTGHGPILGMWDGVSGVSESGDVVVFLADAQLTPDAASSTTLSQAYSYSDGELDLVSVLPGGAPAATTTNAVIGGGNNAEESSGVGGKTVDHAVSADGSRIFWTSTTGGGSSAGNIYVRIDDERTVAVSEGAFAERAQFQTASADGSAAIYTDKGNLYEFDVDSETRTLIAQQAAGIAGASDDLSYLYFVSREALDAGATVGENNLYLRHEGAIRFIGTLSQSDSVSSGDAPSVVNPGPRAHIARVTPDGRHLAFGSNRSLTGYDNADAVDGKPDLEVFLYNADADKLICVSCNPSGARPHGGGTAPPYDRIGLPEKPTSTWRTAAWIPPSEHELNTSRVLSADGDRLFFNALDALVPHDTNGRQDVYQWEKQGTGTCTKSGGCVSLISTGQSAAYSEIVDADADGGNVFIRTQSSIDPEDPGLFDIYDAREGGGFPPPAPPPPPCFGDACQDVPEPPNDATPASAHFKGTGNPVLAHSCGTAARRAVRLSRRAKRLRRAARQSRSPRRSRALRSRSSRFANRAKRLSRNAKRCRRANRRAGR